MQYTWPCFREGRFCGVHQIDGERHITGACYPKVEPLEMADLVMIAIGVRSYFQLDVARVCGGLANNVPTIKARVYAQPRWSADWLHKTFLKGS